MAQRFQYEPLRTRGSIRLLDILPGQPDNPIRCIIRHIHLKTAMGTFEALSYRWGDAKIKRTIFCGKNNTQLEVPINTHHAMLYLREQNSVRTLWIDAVCIDQCNTEEKNSQVKLMGTIYAYSRNTVVFLGDSTRGTQQLFRYLKQIDDYQSRCEDNGGNYPSYDQRPTQSTLQELELLFKREWFSRIWVVQELCNARSVIFMCGHDSATLWAFRECLYGCDARYRQIVNFPVPLQVDDPLHGIVLWSCPTPALRLLSFATQTGLSEASQAEDRILALTPMVSDREYPSSLAKSQLKELQKLVDYTKSPERIYHEFACQALRDGGLALLWMVRHPHSRAMPSWVPDWSQHTHRSFGTMMLSDYFTCTEPSRRLKDFRACVSRVSVRCRSWTPQILVVKGSRCGRIRDLGPLIQIDEENNETRVRDTTSLVDSLISMKNGNDGPEYSEWPDSIKRALQRSQVEDIYDLLRSGYSSNDLFRPIGEPIDNTTGSTMTLRIQGCRIFVTGRGVLGVAPGEAQRGDLICLIKGAMEVCILRGKGHNEWEIISGDCFYLKVAKRYRKQIYYWICINDALRGRRLEEFTII